MISKLCLLYNPITHVIIARYIYLNNNTSHEPLYVWPRTSHPHPVLSTIYRTNKSYSQALLFLE